MNLKLLRQQKNLTQSDVANQIGITQTTYSRYESGARQPDIETLTRLANFYDVSVDQILGRSDPNEGHPLSDTVQERKYKKFPVYGFIACGDPEDMTDYIVDEEYVDSSVYEGRDICLCICRGNSMAPYIEDGDLVILDRNFDLVNGKIYAVQVNGEMATLKKVVKTDEGLDLIPLNPDYHKIHYSPEQYEQLPVRILGQLFRSTKRW